MVLFCQIDRSLLSQNQPNIVVTGFVGTSTNGIIELLVYSDTLNANEAFKVTPPDPDRIVLTRTTSSKLSMDPVIASQLAAWLKAQVDLYQNNFGVLKIPPGSPRSPTKMMTKIKGKRKLTRMKSRNEQMRKQVGQLQKVSRLKMNHKYY